ncbi:ankyrin repeat domain-containing protein [Paenibacillus sp. FSL H8-0034]|uniref:ankyrin repeat domain-containing protein n=1 Tax=Paenibacillus sp. FSL H8-0034 TaxID=2954671 RepID=UPI0030F4D9FE
MLTIKHLAGLIVVVIILVVAWNHFSKSEVQEEPIKPVQVQKKTHTKEEKNAAMLAIINGETDKVRAALEDGMSPDSIARVPGVKIELSFLEIAVRKNRPDIVRLLLDKGASVDVRVKIDPKDPDNTSNFPVIYEVIYGGNVEVASIILEHLSPSDQSYKGIFAGLSWAVAKNANTKLVQLLIDKGADVNYSWNAQTPLIHAIDENNMETLQVLVNAGADLDRLAPYGDYWVNEKKRYIPKQFTALDAAKIWERRNMYDYLKSVGGKGVLYP